MRTCRCVQTECEGTEQDSGESSLERCDLSHSESERNVGHRSGSRHVIIGHGNDAWKGESGN